MILAEGTVQHKVPVCRRQGGQWRWRTPGWRRVAGNKVKTVGWSQIRWDLVSQGKDFILFWRQKEAMGKEVQTEATHYNCFSICLNAIAITFLEKLVNICHLFISNLGPYLLGNPLHWTTSLGSLQQLFSLWPWPSWWMSLFFSSSSAK
jgi:hypothetical protein